ncbi:chromosome partitioning protein ParA [Scytonema sp. UIC 10036]|uniref:chromosome partitioning protein ParA n=1 Tax=Scytonema sp. UIC 10036 TaxID=2304196 RepID=UPI0012DA9BD5|nr:chromosome partitioning protein ParA [Scytonema sp. UIC 10036]MUG97258.1 chromosome partitioning protein ParA [Scytonema sp. UIC 10036]
MQTKNWFVLGVLSFGVGFGISLTLDKDIRRAALTGLITLPATGAGVAFVERQRKQQLNDTQSLQAKASELEKHTEQLKLQESSLQKAISTATLEKEQIEALLKTRQTDLEQLQTAVSSHQFQKQDIERAVLAQNADKQKLEAETQSLQAQIQQLRSQQTELNQALAAIVKEKQQVENELDSSKSQLGQLQSFLTERQNQQEKSLNEQTQQLTQLQNQIAAQESDRSRLTQEISHLEQQKQQLEIQLSHLQLQIANLEQKLGLLNQSLTNITNQQQEAQVSFDSLQTQFRDLQQQKQRIEQELAALSSQKDRLTTEISQIEGSQNQLHTKTRGRYTFADSQYKKLWEEEILPHWTHRDRPVGQRFLGSVRVHRQTSDRVLDVVGKNIQQIDTVTYDSLKKNFYELDKNWLKIFTFATSEYAYYYSSDRFWQGFCDRLDINHNQRVEIALRQVVNEGIALLGLIRASGGYKYVSTLWLQSGVPEQNLNHFAQLVQEIADDFGWWELAHTPVEQLSQVLLSVCKEKHPQWGTLINFLKASYSENTATEPISGQLLQGIALVAQELERQKLPPQALKNEEEREEILGHNYLPENFFLRNWDSLIKVLTPKPGVERNRRDAIARRIQPLKMNLDISDSWNTQLILPEQKLWKPEWRLLRETYCQIPQAHWEDTFPREGDLIVPELIIEVNREAENWNCQLLDHNRQELMKWEYQGISSHLPCLIFDALTGEHLRLNLPNPSILGVEEIICYTPRNIQPTIADGIEIVDSCIPSSMKGWLGRQMRLTVPASSITLTLSETHQSQVITWQIVADNEPLLTGLRLKGKKSIYLEPPTFWYPPVERVLTLNVLIESFDKRVIIARSVENLSPSPRWAAVHLTRWINEPGHYEARFWFAQKRWSYQFEVQSKYQILENPGLKRSRIRNYLGTEQTNLPIKQDTIEKFWAEVIQIEELWPLEEVILILSNNQEKTSYQLQADALGILAIYVSVLHDLLPPSEWYALDYQRLGYEPQRLLEMPTSTQNLSWDWDKQDICITGLTPGKLYSLICWNLLLPDKQPQEVTIPSVKQIEEMTLVNLKLPIGVYHIQLMSGKHLIDNIGWWCFNNQNDMPKAPLGEKTRENYWYAVLDNNASPEQFIKAVQQLKLDFDIKKLETGISSLENRQYYFSSWFKSEILLSKLKRLLEFLKEGSSKKDENTVKSPPSTWYLLQVTPKKRDIFKKILEEAIAKKKLQNIILAVEVPKDSSYENILLLNLKNYQEAYPHVSQLAYFQNLERRPLSLQHANTMLGAK